MLMYNLSSLQSLGLSEMALYKWSDKSWGE